MIERASRETKEEIPPSPLHKKTLHLQKYWLNSKINLTIMKKLIVLAIAVIFLALSASPVLAARKRTPKVRQKAQSAITYSASQGVSSKVRFRPDRLALLINFSGFNNILSGSYELTYTANGIPQGAGGSIIIGDTSTKTLLFGTCSGGVCKYHSNITNAKLKIISITKSGQKIVKPYRIRV